MCSYAQSGFTETLARAHSLVDWLNLVSERGGDDDFKVCSSRRTVVVVVSWKEEKEHSVKHSAVKETLVERTYDLYDVPPQNEVAHSNATQRAMTLEREREPCSRPPVSSIAHRHHRSGT